ncbi:hypothetical protein BKA93DRAFT_497981 [Sparassis latifolia]
MCKMRAPTSRRAISTRLVHTVIVLQRTRTPVRSSGHPQLAHARTAAHSPLTICLIAFAGCPSARSSLSATNVGPLPLPHRGESARWQGVINGDPCREDLCRRTKIPGKRPFPHKHRYRSRDTTEDSSSVRLVMVRGRESLGAICAMTRLICTGSPPILVLGLGRRGVCSDSSVRPTDSYS